MYCFTVMSFGLKNVKAFGLKNVKATYQQVMSIIFREHLFMSAQCYVDDIIVKSRKKEDHLDVLKTMFDLIQTHQLKINLVKSFLEFLMVNSFDSMSRLNRYILSLNRYILIRGNFVLSKKFNL